MNKLTFDVEEWYHVNYPGVDFRPAGVESRLDENMRFLLDLCDRFSLRATCFVLGSVAEEKPELVREIHERGHEVASHGYDHRQISTMSPDEFEGDLSRSLRTLEDTIGHPVKSFRAPSWSVSAGILSWFYDILEKHGIELSSSVYPARTYLYGVPNFPRYPHRPKIESRTFTVTEHPVPVASILGKKIGYSGGFFFRLLPISYIKRQLRIQTQNGSEPFVYLHPREIDPQQPRLSLNYRDRFIHYYGIAGASRKFSRLCEFLRTLP